MNKYFLSSVKSMFFTFVIALMINISSVKIFTETFMLNPDIDLFVWCSVFIAAGMTLLSGSKRRSLIVAGFLIASAVTAGIFYYSSDMIACIKKCIHTVRNMAFYADATVESQAQVLPADLSKCLLAVTIMPTYLMTIVLQRRKNIFIGTSFYLGLLVISVVLNYSYASWYWYVIFMCCLIMLVIFELVRKYDSPVIDDITYKLFIPVSLLVLIPALVSPMHDYDSSKAQNQFDFIMNSAEKIFDSEFVQKLKNGVFKEEEKSSLDSNIQATNAYTNYGMINSERSKLNNKGAFRANGVEIMNIKLSITGQENYDIFNGKSIYLLLTSMGDYDGDNWSRNDISDYMYEAEEENSENENTSAVLFIDTKETAEGLFIPNNVSALHTDTYFNDEIYLNEDSTKNYAWSLKNPEVESDLLPISDEYRDYINNECKYVPDVIRDRILTEVELPSWFIDCYNGDVEITPEEKAKNVMDYVYHTHTYSRGTVYPGNDEHTDFVTWFLRDSKMGYCEHYASSVAVLLRMLDVPTRYCVGYLVYNVTDGVNTSVTDADAHAWCEIWSDEFGWIQIDPTHNMFVEGNHYNDSQKPELTFENNLNKRETDSDISNEENIIVLEDAVPIVAASRYDDWFSDMHRIYVQRKLIRMYQDQTEIAAEDDTVSKGLQIGLSAAVIILVISLVLYKCIQLMIWRRRLSSPNVNSIAKYLGRYTGRIAYLYKIKIPRDITYIVDKALYSSEGIEADELEVLRESSNSFVKNTVKQKDIWKRLLAFMFVLVKIP